MSEREVQAPGWRERRIRRRADYVRIQTTSVRVTSRHFVWLLATDPSSGPGRFGITASRRIGPAVVRNRARRLLREAMRALPDFLPRGVDLVVIVRTALTGLHLSDVVEEMRSVERLIHKRAQALPPPPQQPQGAGA